MNFNAGTLGASMVEGRISQGVVVGDGSDVGGGASIMGTLSGGGKDIISIGTGCLLGANAGLGISLGDGCVVEAGLYVTAGTRVTTPEGETVKARELCGADQPAVPPQLDVRRGRGPAAHRHVGRPERRAAQQRVGVDRAATARRQRGAPRPRRPPASARARSARGPAPPAPKNEPGAQTIAVLEQAHGAGLVVLAVGRRQPQEERRRRRRRCAKPASCSAGQSRSRLRAVARADLLDVRPRRPTRRSTRAGRTPAARRRRWAGTSSARRSAAGRRRRSRTGSPASTSAWTACSTPPRWCRSASCRPLTGASPANQISQ